MSGLQQPAFALEEAQRHTNQIRYAASQLWRLIEEAHERRIWVTYGLDSWSEYVERKLDFGRADAYRLLDQARVVRELESAAEVSPNGDKINLTESAARDIKPALGEAANEVSRRVAKLGPDASDDERAQVVNDVVDEIRDGLRDQSDEPSSDAPTDTVPGDPSGTPADDRPSAAGGGPSDQLMDHLQNDPTWRKSDLLAKVAAGIARSGGGLYTFDPEQLAERLDEDSDTLDMVAAHKLAVDDWHARFNTARRPNLTVIPGGQP